MQRVTDVYMQTERREVGGLLSSTLLSLFLVPSSVSALAEEALEDRRLALALSGAVFTAVAALLLRDIAEHLLDVAAAACVRRLVAGGALNALTHVFTSFAA
jgi:hypothetical protein